MGHDGAHQLPVRVAAANDYDIVVQGLAQLLSGFPDHIQVCDRILVGEPIQNGPIDVVLYDTYGRTGIAADLLGSLVDDPKVRHVAIFSLELSSAVIADARAAGASGVISKSLGADSICEALVRIARGEDVVALADDDASVLDDLAWPGKADGLTERESEVLVLVAEGLTNKEVAAALYLNVETVKTHLRAVLRKLRLRNRVEATAYVLRSGAFSRYQPTAPDDAVREPPDA